MEIRCQSSKRFLMKVDIEEYHDKIKKIGLRLTAPLILEIPCQKCKMIEVYEIYPTHYLHTKSYRFDKN